MLLWQLTTRHLLNIGRNVLSFSLMYCYLKYLNNWESCDFSSDFWSKSVPDETETVAIVKTGASLVRLEATPAPSPGSPLPMWNGNPLTRIRPIFLQNAFALHPLCPDLILTLLDKAQERLSARTFLFKSCFPSAFTCCLQLRHMRSPAPPFESWGQRRVVPATYFYPRPPLATSEVDRILRNEDDLTSTAICRRSTNHPITINNLISAWWNSLRIRVPNR